MSAHAQILNAPIPQSTPRKGVAETPLVRKNVAGTLGFLALCGLCMTNINFVTSAMLGRDQVFSILYLAACLVVLFSFQFKVSQAIGAPGWFWIFAIAMFLGIATRFGFGIETAYFLSPQSNFYRLIIAQVITMCAAMGARHMILRGQSQLMLRVLFGFMALASSTILITKLLPQILVYIGAPQQDRSGGFFEDPNRAGQAVCMAASVGFACLVNETAKWRVVILAGMAMLIPCLFLTFSRSAIVFLTLLVMMQFVISPVFKQKQTLVAMLVIASLIPVGIGVILSRRASVVDLREAANMEAHKERMEGLFQLMRGEINESNTGYRTKVGGVGLKYFFDNPIIGAGYRKLVRMKEIGLGCHNTFIRVLGEAGIFAGLAFIGAVLLIAACGWFSKRREVKCLAIGYMAMYSCACMVSHSVLTNRLTNVMIGVCLGGLSAAVTWHRAEQKKKRQQMRMSYPQQIPVGVAMPPGASIPQPVGIARS